jgi:hypothetical protein
MNNIHLFQNSGSVIGDGNIPIGSLDLGGKIMFAHNLDFSTEDKYRISRSILAMYIQ